jgi:hypothetical protein
MSLTVTDRTTFTEIYKAFLPESESAHVCGAVADGAQLLYALDPLMANGGGQEALNRRLAGREDGAERVRRAMVKEYGPDVAGAALRKVSERTGRNLEKEMTRGDLNVLYQELPLRVTGRMTFTDVYERFKPGPHGSGEAEPLCYESDDGPIRICAGKPLMPDGRDKWKKFGFALYVGALLSIKYGWDITRRLRASVDRLTGSDIAYEVTRGDLELFYQVAQKVQSRHLSELQSVLRPQPTPPKPDPSWSELDSILLSQLKPSQLTPPLPQCDPMLQRHRLEPTLSPQLHQLQKLVRNDATVEMIHYDLVQVWRSAAREEYADVRWPDSDASVQLRTSIYEALIQHNATMFYENWDEELRVFPASDRGRAEERNKADLTEFIGRYFKVKPNDLEFDRIANNLLPYIRVGMDEPMMESALRIASGFGAIPGDVRSDFRLKVNFREDTRSRTVESVSVRGCTRISYLNRNNYTVGHVDRSKGVDLSKYNFVRQENFLISAENLRSDPAEFNPKANLLSASRFDTIDWA